MQIVINDENEDCHRGKKAIDDEFYSLEMEEVIFKERNRCDRKWCGISNNRNRTGYDPADCCGDTYLAMARGRGKKVIKGYGNIAFYITFYNLHNLVAYGYGSVLEIVWGRIITFAPYRYKSHARARRPPLLTSNSSLNKVYH